MDIVILAGGRCSGELRKASGCEFRADLPIAGRRMVDAVSDALEALLESGDRMIIVGAHVDGRETYPAGQSFLDSLKTGLDAASTEHVIVATADIPFVTSDAVRDFIANADRDAALNWAIVPVDVCATKFPNMKRTAIKLREGTFTGGNVAVINRNTFHAIYPILEKAYMNRKKPFKLAAQIGLGTLFRVAFGQILPSTLTLRQLENAIGKFLGTRVKAVISNHAEIGADIDSVEQWRSNTGDRAPLR